MKLIIYTILACVILSCNKNNCVERYNINCLRTYELNPVCGCNNKTYENPSAAGCNGIAEFTLGPCAVQGKYKLVAQLIDPGNGSGTFTNVKSERTIEIREDNEVISQGDLCNMNLENIPQTKGKYLPSSMGIELKDCPGRIYRIHVDGEFLILGYQCFEPCALKFQKI